MSKPESNAALELQALWGDWLDTSERLLKSLHEQTAALTLRDRNRVDRLEPEVDVLLERLREIDAAALDRANRLAQDLGTEASPRSMARSMEKVEGQKLQSTANQVAVAARNVHHVLEKNRRIAEAGAEMPTLGRAMPQRPRPALDKAA